MLKIRVSSKGTDSKVELQTQKASNVNVGYLGMAGPFYSRTPCLDHVWNVFGPCLDHVWNMFGTCCKICPFNFASIPHEKTRIWTRSFQGRFQINPLLISYQKRRNWSRNSPSRIPFNSLLVSYKREDLGHGLQSKISYEFLLNFIWKEKDLDQELPSKISY